MKESKKSEGMEKVLEDFSKLTFGRSRKTSIQNDTCVSCGEDANEFRDAISKKEFSISGLCQKCQDKIFGSKEE